MKKSILVSTLAAVIAAAPAAQAGHKWKHQGYNTFYGQAQVIDVEPIKRTVRISVPERECWEEEVRYPVEYREGRNVAGKMILGGIVGGVIGHQIGRGGGKDAATLAGTLIGASIAHDAVEKSARMVQYDRVGYEERCRVATTYRTEERIDGYHVTYRYQGETFQTRLPYDPGKRIQVRVKVSPVRN